MLSYCRGFTRDLRYMEAYTEEFILSKQQDILARLREWNGDAKVEYLVRLAGVLGCEVDVLVEKV